MLLITADHAGFHLKEKIKLFLSKNKIVFKDLNAKFNPKDDYPVVAKDLVQNFLEIKKQIGQNLPQTSFENLQISTILQSNLANKFFTDEILGLAICGTGQGICMALNRFPEIRAGVAQDLNTAKLLREHNNANVLCLAGRFLDYNLACAIVKTFLESKFLPEDRHLRRIEQLTNLKIDSENLN